MNRNFNKKINEKIMIGKTMQSIRKSLGLTQEQVAEKLFLAPRYISKDYLNTTELEYDDKLIGFTHLTNPEKEIVIKLIEFMNAQKNKTWDF